MKNYYRNYMIKQKKRERAINKKSDMYGEQFIAKMQSYVDEINNPEVNYKRKINLTTKINDISSKIEDIKSSVSKIEKHNNRDFNFSSNTKVFNPFIKMSNSFSEQTAKMYHKFFKVDFKDIVSDRKQSGQETIRRAIEANNEINYSINRKRASSSLTSVNKALDKHDELHKKVIFDLEILGGKNNQGVQDLDLITEMAYGVFNTETNQMDAKAIMNGITERQYDEFMKLYNRDQSTFNQREKIIFDSVSKYGHKDTVIKTNADGTKYVDKLTGAAHGTKEEFKKGLELLKANKVSLDRNVDEFGLNPFDREMYSFIKSYNQADTQLTGYNIKEADIPWVRRYIDRTPNLKKVLKDNNLNVDIDEERILDMYGIVEQASTSGKFLRDMTQKAKNSGYYDELIGKGETLYRQENLFASYFGMDITSAHNALGDIRTFSEVFKDPDAIGSFKKYLPQEERMTLQTGQRMFMKNNIMDSDSIFTFDLDNKNRNYRTSQGVLIDADSLETSNQNFRESFIKKNRIYEVGSIQKFSPSEEFKKTIDASEKHGLSADELYIMNLNEITNNENAKSVYMVGTKHSLEKNISNSGIVYRNADGEIIEDAAKLISKRGESVTKNFEEKLVKEITLENNSEKASHILRNARYGNIEKVAEYMSSYKDINDSNMMQVAKEISDKVAANETLVNTRDNVQSMIMPMLTVKDKMVDMNKHINELGFNYAQKEHFMKSLTEQLYMGAERTKELNTRNYQDSIFTLDVSGLYKKRHNKISGEVSSLIDIDLDPGNEMLFLDALKRKSGKTINKNDTTGMKEEIRRFVSFAKKNEMLVDFDDSEEFYNNTPQIMAVSIIDNFRAQRISDTTAGRKVTDTADIDDIISIVQKMDKEHFDSVVKSVASQVPEMKSISSKDEIIKNLTELMVDNIDTGLLKEYAYDDYAIEHIKKVHHVTSRDAVNLAEEIYKGIDKSKSKLIIDDGRVMIENAREVSDIVLPRFKFDEQAGMYYIQQGGQKLSPELKLSTSGGRISMQSAIGQSMDDTFKLGVVLNDPNRTDADRYQATVGYLSNIRKGIGEASDVFRGDRHDRKSQFLIDINKGIDYLQENEILDKLHQYNERGLLEDGEELIYLLQKRKESGTEYVRDALNVAFTKNIEPIRDIFKESAVDEETREIMDNVMYGITKASHTAKGKVAVVNQSSGLNMYDYKRGIQNQQRFKRLRITEELDSIDYDPMLKTSVGEAFSDIRMPGVEDRVVDNINVKRFEADRRILEEMLSQIDPSDIYEEEAIEHLLDTANITEGKGLISGRIYDSFENTVNLQRVNANKEIHMQKEISIRNVGDNIRRAEELKEKSEILSSIEIDKSGNVKVKYSKGRRVRRGDNLISTVGFGEVEERNLAKYEGVIQHRYTSQGIEIKESELEDIINRAIKSGDITDVSEEKIKKFLEDEGFKSEFINKRFYENRLQKVMFNETEKHMSEVLLAGIGSADKDILKTMDLLGLGDIENRVLSKEFFDSFRSPEELKDSILMSGSKLSTDDINRLVTEVGFKDYEDFHERLVKERYSISDFIKKHFDADTIAVNEDLKHGNMQSIVMEGLNLSMDKKYEQLVKEGMSSDEAMALAKREVYDDVTGFFGQGKMLNFEDGRIGVNEVKFDDDSNLVNLQGLQDYFKETLGEETYEDWNRNRLAVKTNIAFMDDASNMSMSNIDASKFDSSQKAARYSDAEHTLLKSKVYDEESLENIRKILPEDMYRKYFDDVNEGEFVYGDFLKNIEKRIFEDSKHNYAIYKGKTKAQWEEAINAGEEISDLDMKSIRRMENIGEFESIARNLESISGGNVTVDKVHNVDKIRKGTLASDFNMGNIKRDTLERSGFESVNIADLVSTAGDSNSYLDELGMSDMQSVVDRNLIIDISDSRFLNEDTMHKYGISSEIAINRLDIKPVGEDEIVNPIIKDINNIIGIKSELEAGNLTEDESAKLYNRIASLQENITEQLRKQTSSKKSMLEDVSKINMYGSGTRKYTLFDVTEGSSRSRFLNTATFDGTNLIDMHNNNMRVMFNAAGIEQFEGMGLLDEDYLKEIGLSRAQAIERFKTKGVEGLIHRNPTNYESSIQSSILYLDESLNDSNEIFGYAAGAIAAKADADGDTASFYVSKYINKDGTEVDAFRASIHGDEAIRRQRESHKRSMLHNAAVINEDYQKKLDKDADKLKNIRKVDTMFEETSNSIMEGHYRADAIRNMAPDVKKKYSSLYKEMEGSIVEDLLKDKRIDRASDITRFIEENTEEYNSMLLDRAKSMSNAEEYIKAADIVNEEMRHIAAEIGNKKQAAAGEMELQVRRLREVRNLRAPDLGLSSDDTAIFEHASSATIEGFLSPKHGMSAQIGMSEEYAEAIRSMAIDRNPEKYISYMNRNVTDRIKPANVLGRLSEQQDEVKQIEEIINKSARVHMDILDEEGYKYFLSAQRDGIGSIKGVREELYNRFENRAEFSDKNSLGNMVAEAITKDGLPQASHVDSDDLKKEVSKNLEGMKKQWTQKERQTGSIVKDFMETLTDKMKKSGISGRTLAFGALGMAGATMVMGYVAGNPSQPADTHAENEQANANSSNYYQSYDNLSDDYGYLVNNNTNGYTVNVRANSNLSSQKNANIISEAIFQSGTQNVNIAVNMNDNTGNINNEKLADMIGALF